MHALRHICLWYTLLAVPCLAGVSGESQQPEAPSHTDEESIRSIATSIATSLEVLLERFFPISDTERQYHRSRASTDTFSTITRTLSRVDALLQEAVSGTTQWDRKKLEDTVLPWKERLEKAMAMADGWNNWTGSWFGWNDGEKQEL